MTVKRLSEQFYESDRFCTYPTDVLDNCAKWPVVVMVDGKAHVLKSIAYEQGAMMLIASDSEWKRKKCLGKKTCKNVKGATKC